MEYKILGKSGIKVSEISFGCMSLSEDHTQNASLLHSAFDQGINFFDTADLYQFGENEASVGQAFKGMREKVVIATKVGNQWKEDQSGWDWNPSKAYILKAVDDSLARLQTDYIDLYQLHGGTIDDPIDETIEAFERLKESGKIRAYGISSIRPNVIRSYVEKSNIDSVMMQYSLLDRRPEESCLQLLNENSISVITRGSLAKGLLAGKNAQEYLSRSETEVLQAGKAIAKLAENRNASAAQIALRFVLANAAVTSSVCGIRTMEQLKDVAATQNVQALIKGEIESLKDAIQPNVYEAHR